MLIRVLTMNYVERRKDEGVFSERIGQRTKMAAGVFQGLRVVFVEHQQGSLRLQAGGE
jgi:hypothetical protein